MESNIHALALALRCGCTSCVQTRRHMHAYVVRTYFGVLSALLSTEYSIEAKVERNPRNGEIGRTRRAQAERRQRRRLRWLNRSLSLTLLKRWLGFAWLTWPWLVTWHCTSTGTINSNSNGTRLSLAGLACAWLGLALLRALLCARSLHNYYDPRAPCLNVAFPSGVSGRVMAWDGMACTH